MRSQPTSGHRTIYLALPLCPLLTPLKSLFPIPSVRAATPSPTETVEAKPEGLFLTHVTLYQPRVWSQDAEE